MKNQKSLAPLIIILVIIGILVAGHFIFYRKSCEPFSGMTAGIDSHYVRSNDKLYFCQTLFEKFIGVASAEKELRNKIALACSSGGKIISTECAQLLNEFRTKYPGKIDAGENISNSSSGPTANWKTYVNEKYDYSFKYPPECKYGVWTPEVLPTEHFCLLSIENPDDVLLNTRYTDEKEGLVSAAFSVLRCSVSWDKEVDSPCSPVQAFLHNPPPGTDLISWLKENFKGDGFNGNIPNKPNFEIDEMPAVKVLNEFPLDPPNERIFFIKNDKLFDITLWYVDSESNKELYNQILSTFKFIKPVE